MENDETIDLTGRTFQLWDYSPSMRRMLIRSPQAPGIDFNIDIIFWAITHIDIAPYLGEITIHDEPTEDGWREQTHHNHIQRGYAPYCRNDLYHPKILHGHL